MSPGVLSTHLSCAEIHQRVADELTRSMVGRLTSSHRVHIVGAERPEPRSLLFELRCILLPPAGGVDWRMLQEEQDVGFGDPFERGSSVLIGRRVEQRRFG